MGQVSSAADDLLARIRADRREWIAAVPGSAEERRIMKSCYVGFVTLDTLLSTPGREAPDAWTPTMGMIALLEGEIGGLNDANADLTASKNRLTVALHEARAEIARLKKNAEHDQDRPTSTI